MNRKRILSLARKIEKTELYNHSTMDFNMGRWRAESPSDPTSKCADKAGHKCKTVCCIAGWAVPKERDNNKIISTAREYLHLDYTQMDSLFFAKGRDELAYPHLVDIPWQQAVATRTMGS